MMLRILLADDHKITRHGLKSLLDQQKNMTVVGEAENGRQAVRLAIEHKPDIIVMDISMPELNGIEATRQIKSELPDTKIIALSMYSDKRYITGMLKAGFRSSRRADCSHCIRFQRSKLPQPKYRCHSHEGLCQYPGRE